MAQCPVWERKAELFETHGGQGAQRTGSEDLPPKAGYRRACICQYQGVEAAEPIHPEREGQSQYSVASLLYDSQHREDSKLWICFCRKLKGEAANRVKSIEQVDK